MEENCFEIHIHYGEKYKKLFYSFRFCFFLMKSPSLHALQEEGCGINDAVSTLSGNSAVTVMPADPIFSLYLGVLEYTMIILGLAKYF